MLRKLQIKFVAINMSIVTVMLCVILGLVMHFTQTRLEQSSLDMMRAMAMDGSRPRKPDADIPAPRLPFFILDGTPAGEGDRESVSWFDLSDPKLVEQLYDEGRSAPEDSGIIPEYKLRFLRVKTPHRERIIFSDISGELNTMEGLRKSCLMIGSLSFFVFLGLSILLARWAVGPVARAWTQQKRFISDASHELKTPLTVISANAELLQADCDEKSRREFSGNILTMTHQMKALVESMLELARVDDGARKRRLGEVALSSLVEEAALNFEALLYERGLELSCEVEGDITVRGDSGEIKQLTDILLDNAGKYSLTPGEVRLKLGREGRHALLELSNPAEPMDDTALKNIFKRFYRLDDARSRDGSFGLGLAIAQQIVTAHKGEINAAYREGRIYFAVRLPLA